MKKKASNLMAVLILSSASLVFTSCKEEAKGEESLVETTTTGTMEEVSSVPKFEVMTKEKQANLTPHTVLESFKTGNKFFVENDRTIRDHSKRVRLAEEGQFPQAVVLSCVDSRIPVEDVFDKGLGDLFVARVAGNFANVDILGSMEFACKVAGAKLVLVLGHDHCGAVMGTIDNVELGNLTATLNNIKPAVALSKDFKGEKMTSNKDFVDYVAQNNVKLNVEKIRKSSSILKEMETNGEIKIVGAYYDLNTGEAKFFE